MMRRIFFIFALCFSFSFPLELQSQVAFDNSNTSCEDFALLGDTLAGDETEWTASIACGSFNEDLSAPFNSFTDCVSSRDPLPATLGGVVPGYGLLTNTAAHGANRCFNTGGSAQFSQSTFTNNNLSTIDANPLRLGPLATANFDSQAFDDFVHSVALDPADAFSITEVELVTSQASGGFAHMDSDSISIQDVAIGSVLTPNPAYFLNQSLGAVGSVEDSDASDSAAMALDCDGDGLDELILSVVGESDRPYILVLDNIGGVLQPAAVATDLFALPLASAVSVFLDHGDFNQDSQEDIAFLISGETEDVVGFCVSNGACDFNCPNDLTSPHARDLAPFCTDSSSPPDCEVIATGVAAGDFDGDGLQDLAVAQSLSLPGVGAFDRESTDPVELRYLIHDGDLDNLGAWANIRRLTNTVFGFAFNHSKTLRKGRFSSLAITQEIDELAVGVNRVAAPGGERIFIGPSVDILATDGLGGIEEAVSLNFTEDSAALMMDMAVEDFDHCGGQDVMALYVDGNPPGLSPSLTPNLVLSTINDSLPRAALFLNTNEAPLLSAPVVSGELVSGQVLNLAADCSDLTLDWRSYEWLVLSAPDGASVQLNDLESSLEASEVAINTQFVTDTPGDYVLELSCEDFCEARAVTTVAFSIAQQTTPPAPPPSGLLVNTQGACVAHLQTVASSHLTLSWAFYFFGALGLLLWRFYKA